MEIRYPAVLHPEETGGYHVQFVDMDDTFTYGETEEEALFNATEALSVMLEAKLEHGQPIPVPSPNVPDGHYVSPDAKTQAALLVHFARGDRPLADLARALGTSWPSAKRLEDPSHWPSLKTLERAAAALGKKLVLAFE
ncbi:type II toxin-antitoxin system HicB family antitoxin [Fundidesulfovibrio terrae]|uniref:type II toxin-antitoxin system HicB family antitoxin n=1 Tax=Fundidesulfovibrio terrae TaxID=2922866 RepID=UPI001FAE9BD8|nr:type II toxin-antitoxin system HicB family antitoxin [Fundidesulfovibrio terrae]